MRNHFIVYITEVIEELVFPMSCHVFEGRANVISRPACECTLPVISTEVIAIEGGIHRLSKNGIT